MATQNVLYAALNNGQVEVDYAYDDVSLLILSVSVRNDGSSGTLSVTIYNLDGSVQLWGPQTRSFQPGTNVINLSGLNQHMVMRGGKFGGTHAQLPFTLSVGWSSV